MPCHRSPGRASPNTTGAWQTGPWFLRSERCYLIPGDLRWLSAAAGFRKPWRRADRLPWVHPPDPDADPCRCRPASSCAMRIRSRRRARRFRRSRGLWAARGFTPIVAWAAMDVGDRRNIRRRRIGRARPAAAVRIGILDHGLAPSAAGFEMVHAAFVAASRTTSINSCDRGHRCRHAVLPRPSRGY